MLDEKYGVTSTGFSRKRLDTIIEELHDDLSNGFGFNTRNNPKSFLNVLVTDFADKIAELWEVAEQNYNAQVPSTAEGYSLDRVAQLGGSIRKTPTPSVYTILCTGANGTIVPAYSRLSTKTNPPVELVNHQEGVISTDKCVYAEISTVGSFEVGHSFSVKIDEHSFDIKHELQMIEDHAEDKDIYEELRDKLSETADLLGYSLSCKKESVGAEERNISLIIKFDDPSVPHSILLSSNLNASSVTTPIKFSTQQSGNIILPKDSVTDIKSAVSGLDSVTNLEDYIHGRDLETDSELRRSYVEKIFIRSRTMLESIKSAILANCNGVTNVYGYENDTNINNVFETHGNNRLAHSVEMIVEGGDPHEIAEQIFAAKAAGINTSHCDGAFSTDEHKDFAIEVDVNDDYGNPVKVRFSRPVPVYFDVEIEIEAATKESPAPNSFELIKEIVSENINSLHPGDDLIPQKFLAELYKKVPGVYNYKFHLKEHNSDDTGAESITGLEYNKVARCNKENVTIIFSSRNGAVV